MLRWPTTGRRFRSSSRNEVFVGASRPLLAAIGSRRGRPGPGRRVAPRGIGRRRHDTSLMRVRSWPARRPAARRRSRVCREPSAGDDRAHAVPGTAANSPSGTSPRGSRRLGDGCHRPRHIRLPRRSVRRDVPGAAARV